MWRGQKTEPGCLLKCPLCTSSAEHLERLRATEKMKTRELRREGANYDSIYICSSTFACAQLAAGAACRLVEAVLAGEVPVLWGGDLGLLARKSWEHGGGGQERGSSESWARPEERGFGEQSAMEGDYSPSSPEALLTGKCTQGDGAYRAVGRRP